MRTGKIKFDIFFKTISCAASAAWLVVKLVCYTATAFVVAGIFFRALNRLVNEA
jgi:hypothetical protein